MIIRTNCLNQEELLCFLRSEQDVLPQITAHISTCEKCQQALGEHPSFDILEQFLPAESFDSACNTENPQIDLRLKSIPREAQCLPDENSPVPQKIESIEVITEIGRGGLGTAYLAYDHATGRERVLKVLNNDYPFSRRSIQKCRRSIRVLGKLRAPSLNTATFMTSMDGQPCLLADYQQGMDLQDRIQTCGPLSMQDSCRAIRQAAVALQQAHSAGVLHLNIKPGNLLISHDGRIMILDCGLATLVQDTLTQADFTTSVFVQESASYMSPEQALDVSTADHRSDIYSLGCTLAYLLSGRTLFKHATALQTIVAHRSESPIEISGLAAGAAAELSQILIRMLATRPADRYQSMEAVAADLEPLLETGMASGDIISQPCMPAPASPSDWLQLKGRRRH